MKRQKASYIALVSLIVSLVLIASSNNVFALTKDETRVVTEVKNSFDDFKRAKESEYKDIESTFKKLYTRDLEVAEADYKKLLRMASEDYKTLLKGYSSSSLDLYYSNINSYSYSMDDYYSEVYRYAGGMDDYYGDVYRYSGALDNYYGEIYRYAGTLDDLYGEVYRYGGVVDDFEGEGGDTEAFRRKFMLLKDSTDKSLKDTRDQTIKDIQRQRIKTFEQLLNAKKDAKIEMSAARKKATGYGKDYGTFGIELYNLALIIIQDKPLLTDQPVTEVNGTIIVPMRSIFEALGAEVSYGEQDQSITGKRGNTKVTLTLSQKKAVVNGQSLLLTEAPRTINNTTMVPLRFVGEALGAEVIWDETLQTISVK